jgi:hypothetical protein
MQDAVHCSGARPLHVGRGKPCLGAAFVPGEVAEARADPLPHDVSGRERFEVREHGRNQSFMPHDVESRVRAAHLQRAQQGAGEARPRESAPRRG